MKKTTIILFIFAFFAISSGISRNVYSQNENSIVIPLQVGENPPVQFETLWIDQINLWHDTIPRERFALDVRLRIADTNKEWNTGFRYYHERKFALSGWNTPSPRVFENYLFGWKINEDVISLVVGKLDFGKAFYLANRQTIVIENLSITFREEGHAHGETAPGQPATWGFYRILLSEGCKEKEFHFSLLCGDVPNDFLELGNYRVEVLSIGVSFSKLKVTKKSNE